MVDSKENYKFDLGVKGLTLFKSAYVWDLIDKQVSKETVI